MEAFMDLKKFVIENGLTNEVWVTKTGCIGFCNDVGCTMVLYPDNIWFMETIEEDLEKVKDFIIKDIR